MERRAIDQDLRRHAGVLRESNRDDDLGGLIRKALPIRDYAEPLGDSRWNDLAWFANSGGLDRMEATAEPAPTDQSVHDAFQSLRHLRELRQQCLRDLSPQRSPKEQFPLETLHRIAAAHGVLCAVEARLWELRPEVLAAQISPSRAAFAVLTAVALNDGVEAVIADLADGWAEPVRDRAIGQLIAAGAMWESAPDRYVLSPLGVATRALMIDESPVDDEPADEIQGDEPPTGDRAPDDD